MDTRSCDRHFFMHISKTGGTTVQNFLKSHGRLSSNVTCCRDDAVVQRTLAEWAPSPSLLAYELPLRSVRHTSGTSGQLCVWTMVREPSLWLQSALDHQQRLFKMNSTDSLHRRQGHLMHTRPYQANWFVGAQMRGGVRLAIYRTDALPHLVRDLAAALRIRCDGTRGCTAPSANVGGGQGIPIPSEVTEEYALDEALFRCIPPDGLVLQLREDGTASAARSGALQPCVELLLSIMRQTRTIGNVTGCVESLSEAGNPVFLSRQHQMDNRRDHRACL